ncbi:MAG: ADP-forming succinate--CoA ligase subunit beta, partial [Alphaproteobacteria bacterium]|nr:ADP-forming succinate--CoA ligase subunit beta [Alphaproteobacteria bacterium]
QTDANGQMVRTVYLEAGVGIDREFYISFVLDRSKGCMCLIASAQGGSDIESVAHDAPDQICKLSIYPATGLMPLHIRQVAQVLGLSQGQHQAELDKVLRTLYDFVVTYDAELIEINPLVLTDQGNLHVLDAKMSVDDNALFRQPDILALKDDTQQSPIETQAQEYDLNYIKLNGTIGCMVNGAGLAMATMDLIKARGGEPANFLDVGGSASAEKVEAAFKMIMSDPDVMGIFVNIFGGIMKCDIIAQGIVAAVQSLDLKVPLVVRLQGTNAKEGQAILQASTVPIVAIDDLDAAAQAIVQHVCGK